MNEALEPPGAGSGGATRFPYTHRVASSAYIFRDGKLLLMKRTNPPRVWAPVGGHLEVDEDPLEGLRREVREETGLEVEILLLAGAWFGSIDGKRPPLLGLDYIAESEEGEVTLNWEHSEAVWAAREDLASGAIRTVDDGGHGYQLPFVLYAFDLYLGLRSAEL